MDERVVSVKYELYQEGSDERVGKTDRVQVSLDSDAETVSIAFREAVHERRKVRDLSHCSAANLRVYPESNPDEELLDEDFLRFLLNNAPEKIRVVAPPALRMTALSSPHPSSGSFLGSSRARSTGSAVGRSSMELGFGAPGGGVTRRDSSSSGAKRGESDSMVVFVKTGDANFPVEVERTATVQAVKARIREQEQIPLEQQRLIYGGVELEPNRSLSDYNIHQGSELQLVLSIGSSLST